MTQLDASTALALDAAAPAPAEGAVGCNPDDGSQDAHAQRHGDHGQDGEADEPEVEMVEANAAPTNETTSIMMLLAKATEELRLHPRDDGSVEEPETVQTNVAATEEVENNQRQLSDAPHDASSEVQDRPKKRGRGRPRKDATETPETSEEPKPKRGRGRPRKDAMETTAVVVAPVGHRRSMRVVHIVDDKSTEAQEATPTVRRKVGRPRKDTSTSAANTTKPTKLLDRKSRRSKKAVQRYGHEDAPDIESSREMSDGHESNRSGSEYEVSNDDASENEYAAPKPSSLLPSGGKRPRGRPRIHPKKPENVPKKPRGRPRIHPKEPPSETPPKRGRPPKKARVNPTPESPAPTDGSSQTSVEPSAASPMSPRPTVENSVAGDQFDI
ncbi:hypothetical protein SPRG_02187 [Saprolegnia parasitica CBS 223.65]|uniref:AT hook domain-containing protein n=1 Tax=Saprolegnia parasitica (strain CBS 223.65) TaxID=695850 RepID=A0A067CVU3_SAPPC|nr:hypothetical protein SPRG_02187 [Saprolegnia parasitica CBS 223.65]KDO33380.1 hypothetical protein SPRG_02187 [Saprolegnia parasitica CBS 223.65]|eukprot:XP_012196128.1 hypothetical protein SPRG_02187 [Saprolegnia parasitica CBS 223.65]